MIFFLIFNFFFIQIYVIYTQDEQIALASVKCTLDSFNIINKGFKRRKGETVVNILRQLVP